MGILVFVLGAACGDPKSTGVDTVICLDISDSMNGERFNAAKRAVHSLLDGKVALQLNTFSCIKNLRKFSFPLLEKWL